MASLSQVLAARRPRPIVETAVVTGVVALNMITVNSSGSDERAWCPLHLSPLPGDTVSIMRGPQGVLVVALLAAGLDVEPPAPPAPDESGMATVLATSAHTWLTPIGGFDLPNSWEVLTSLPDQIFNARSAAIGGKVYLVGGYTDHALASLWEWDTEAGSWTQRADMPAARWEPVVAAIGGKLYVAGGYGQDDVSTSTLYEWDQATNTWATKTAMPAARSWGAATIIGTKLYVVGGYSGTYPNDIKQSTLYEWDQATNTWNSRATIPIAPVDGVAAADAANVYMIDEQKVVYRWHQSGNSWSTPGYTPPDASRFYRTMDQIDGDLYLIDYDYTLSRIDLTSGEWDQISQMPVDVSFGESAVVGADIYYIGPPDDLNTTTVLQRWTRDGSASPGDLRYNFDWSRTWAQQGTIDPDEWIGQICYPHLWMAGYARYVSDLAVYLAAIGAGGPVEFSIAPSSQGFPQPVNVYGPAAPQAYAAPITATLTPGEPEWVDLPSAWIAIISGGGLVINGSAVGRLAGPGQNPQAGMLRMNVAPI